MIRAPPTCQSAIEFLAQFLMSIIAARETRLLNFLCQSSKIPRFQNLDLQLKSGALRKDLPITYLTTVQRSK